MLTLIIVIIIAVAIAIVIMAVAIIISTPNCSRQLHSYGPLPSSLRACRRHESAAQSVLFFSMAALVTHVLSTTSPLTPLTATFYPDALHRPLNGGSS